MNEEGARVLKRTNHDPLTNVPRPFQSWGRGLILVAEGDDTSREWTRDTLECEGYGVLVAPDAVRFMELLVRYRSSVQVVVCGANLDGNTAYHLVHLVRGNLKDDVPIVVRIDGAPEPDARPYLPDAVLTIPFSGTQLIATIGELAQRRSGGVTAEKAEAGVPGVPDPMITSSMPSTSTAAGSILLRNPLTSRKSLHRLPCRKECDGSRPS